MFNSSFSKRVRKKIIGIKTRVPLLSGRYTQYINLDNAASTPPCKRSFKKVKELLQWYSNVHRGAGFKSQLTTAVYEKVHKLIAQFTGANPEKNSTIFVKNTTEAINKLANSLNLTKDDIVITTSMEHHSNLLPWRNNSKVKYVKLNKQGRLDLNDLEAKLKDYQAQTKLVAVSGASNVTGYINPIHKIARLAHKYNARILVDAAQLIPHRPINIKPNDHPEHIDFLAFSAHKMYAPFGTGVLIGPTKFFKQHPPDYSGGGTIKVVTLNDVIWADLPDKYEAGTPNIPGAVALGAAVKFMEEINWNNLINHVDKLLNYLVNELNKIDEVRLYGKMKKGKTNKQVGVIPFNLKSIPHSLTAAMLAHEFGIGVRNGCFCAHPYIYHLLDLSEDKIKDLKEKLKQNNYTDKPGLVRISLGCYNTFSEINKLIKALKTIIKRKKSGANLTKKYQFNPSTGKYLPRAKFNYNKFFSL